MARGTIVVGGRVPALHPIQPDFSCGCPAPPSTRHMVTMKPTALSRPWDAPPWLDRVRLPADSHGLLPRCMTDPADGGHVEGMAGTLGRWKQPMLRKKSRSTCP